MATIRPGNDISARKPGSEDMNVKAAQSAGLKLSSSQIRQMQDFQRQRKIDDEKKAADERRQEQLKQEQQRKDAEEKQEREYQKIKTEYENRVRFESVKSYDDGKYTVSMSDGSERVLSGDELKSLLRSDRDFYAKYSTNQQEILDNYNEIIRDVDEIPDRVARNKEIEEENKRIEAENLKIQAQNAEIESLNKQYDNDSSYFVKKVEFNEKKGVWNVMNKRGQVTEYSSYEEVAARIGEDKAVTQAYLENAYGVDGEISDEESGKIADALGNYDTWIENVRKSGDITEREFNKMAEINEMQNSFAQNVEFNTESGKWVVTDKSGATSEYDNYKDVYDRVRSEKMQLIRNLNEYASIDGLISANEMGTISNVTNEYNKWLESIYDAGEETQEAWNEYQTQLNASSVSDNWSNQINQNVSGMDSKIKDYAADYLKNTGYSTNSNDATQAGLDLTRMIRSDISENYSGYVAWEDEEAWRYTSNYLGGTYSIEKKGEKNGKTVYYYLDGTMPTDAVDKQNNPIADPKNFVGTMYKNVDGKLYEYKRKQIGYYGTDDDDETIRKALINADYDVASDYGDWNALGKSMRGYFDKKERPNPNNSSHATIVDPVTGETWTSAGNGKTSSVSQMSDQMRWAVSEEGDKAFADYFKNIRISNEQSAAISQAVNASLAAGMTKADALALRDSMVSELRFNNTSEATKGLIESFEPVVEKSEPAAPVVFKPSESISISDIRAGNIALDQWESIQFVPETDNQATYQSRVNYWVSEFKTAATDKDGLSGWDFWQKAIRSDYAKGSFFDPETNVPMPKRNPSDENGSVLSIIVPDESYDQLTSGIISPEYLISYASGSEKYTEIPGTGRQHSGNGGNINSGNANVGLKDVSEFLKYVPLYGHFIEPALHAGTVYDEAIATYNGNPTQIEPEVKNTDGRFYEKLFEENKIDLNAAIPDTLAIYDALLYSAQETIYPMYTTAFGEGFWQDVARGAVIDNLFGAAQIGSLSLRTSAKTYDDLMYDDMRFEPAFAENVATALGQMGGSIAVGFRDDPVATAAGFISLDMLAHGATRGLSKAANVAKIGTMSAKNVIAYNGLLPDRLMKNNPMILADAGTDWAVSVRKMSDGNLINYRNPMKSDSIFRNWENAVYTALNGNIKDLINTGYVSYETMTHRNLVERGNDILKGGFPGPYPIEAGGTVEYAMSKFKINDSVPVLPEFKATIEQLGDDATVSVSRISDNSLRVRFTPADPTNVKSLAESVDFEFVGGFVDGQPTLNIRRMGSFNDIVEYTTYNKATKETKTHEMTGLTNNVLPDMYSGVGDSQILPVMNYLSDVFTTESVKADGTPISGKTFSQKLYEELYYPFRESVTELKAMTDATQYHAAGVHATGHRSGAFEYSKPPKDPSAKHAPEPGYFTAPIAKPDPSLSPKFLGATPVDIRIGKPEIGDLGFTDAYRGAYTLLTETPAALRGEAALTADIVLAKSIENLPDDVVGNKKAAKGFFYGVGDRSRPDVLYATFKENANVNANKIFENEAVLVPGAEMERLGAVGYTLVPNSISIYGHKVASYKMPVFIDAYGTTGKFKRTDRARATGIFRDPEKGVVLVEEKNGLLNLIGGGVDEGEKPKAAMLREAWEETGITKKDVSSVKKVKGYEDPEYRRSTSPYLPGEYKNIHTVYEVDVNPGTTFKKIDEIQSIVYWDPKSPIPEKANTATKEILREYQNRRNSVSRTEAVLGTAAVVLDSSKNDLADSFRIIENSELRNVDFKSRQTPKEAVLTTAETTRMPSQKKKTSPIETDEDSFMSAIRQTEQETYYIRTNVPKKGTVNTRYYGSEEKATESGRYPYGQLAEYYGRGIESMYPETYTRKNRRKTQDGGTSKYSGRNSEQPSGYSYPKPKTPNTRYSSGFAGMTYPRPPKITDPVPDLITSVPLIKGHGDDEKYDYSTRVKTPYYRMPYPNDPYPGTPYPKNYPYREIPEPEPETPIPHSKERYKRKPTPKPEMRIPKEKEQPKKEEDKKKKSKRKNRVKKERENRAKNPIEDVYKTFMSNSKKGF